MYVKAKMIPVEITPRIRGGEIKERSRVQEWSSSRIQV
jgi:hypothetical protein